MIEADQAAALVQQEELVTALLPLQACAFEGTEMRRGHVSLPISTRASQEKKKVHKTERLRASDAFIVLSLPCLVLCLDKTLIKAAATGKGEFVLIFRCQGKTKLMELV